MGKSHILSVVNKFGELRVPEFYFRILMFRILKPYRVKLMQNTSIKALK